MSEETTTTTTTNAEPQVVVMSPTAEEEEKVEAAAEAILTTDEKNPATTTKENDDDEEEEGETEDLPPLRMHATRVPAKLSAQNLKKVSGESSDGGSGGIGPGSDAGSDSNSSGHHRHPGHVRRHSGQRSGTRSRSHSPSVNKQNTDSTFELTSNSSISSIQELQDADPDLLLDKSGFEDLDPSMGEKSKSELMATPTLTAVNERLSDDTLEDVKAFSDVTPPNPKSKASSMVSKINAAMIPSRDNSVCGVSATLDEIEEEDDDDEDNDDNESKESGGAGQQCAVILENMENLNIEDDKANQQKSDESVPSDW